MTEASIPVDLFNPGQVFACLGFLEAAEALCGDAEGGFDWRDQANVRFGISAGGSEHPFAVALDWLVKAQLRRFAPTGYEDPPPKKKQRSSNDGELSNEDEDEAESELASNLEFGDSFPSGEPDRMALPVLLLPEDGQDIQLGHWSDGSSRESFKLYSGNRSAFSISKSMIHGQRSKPTKKDSTGKLKAFGISQLWEQQRDKVIEEPFHVLTAMGGSFNFDPRGGWTSIDAGYSPNDQGHAVSASPIVELFAAWGLENARPEDLDTRNARSVRYGAWGERLPPMLARPALAGAPLPVPMRRFQFELELSGKNKVVTFAREEP